MAHIKPPNMKSKRIRYLRRLIFRQKLVDTVLKLFIFITSITFIIDSLIE